MNLERIAGDDNLNAFVAAEVNKKMKKGLP